MNILKIKKLKNGKYKLLCDNGEVFEVYDEVILKNNLLYHKHIDKETVTKINNENNYYNYYNKALKYLNTKMRSKKEMYCYLEKFELSNSEQTAIVDKLTEIGLLNDEQYVKAYVNDKMYLSNIGPNKIKRELLNHDIAEEIIDCYLKDIDHELLLDKINKYIVKKITSNHKLSKYQLEKKIINDLVNNGYSREDICEQLGNFQLLDNEDVLKKEYHKIYSKLAKKYQGSDLNFRVINKLRQKGFLKEEIEQIMEENI